MSKALEMKLKR